MFNNFQNKYFIDCIFTDISYIDITDFNKVFIFSSESEITNKINLSFLANKKNEVFLNSKYLKEISLLENNESFNKLNFKEILLKILLNIIYNIEGNLEIFTNESIRKFVVFYKDNDKDKEKCEEE